MKDIKQNVADNLAYLRRRDNYKQSDVANKLNYTDKAVSKWENGDTLPDIDVLVSLAELYGVSLDYLTTPRETNALKDNVASKRDVVLYNKLAITLLSVSVIWILSTVIYVYVKIITGFDPWILFVWSVPVSCLLFLIFNSIWGNRRKNFIWASLITWTFLASVFIQFLAQSIWLIFLAGIPFQVAIILWSQVKK